MAQRQDMYHAQNLMTEARLADAATLPSLFFKVLVHMPLTSSTCQSLLFLLCSVAFQRHILGHDGPDFLVHLCPDAILVHSKASSCKHTSSAHNYEQDCPQRQAACRQTPVNDC